MMTRKMEFVLEYKAYKAKVRLGSDGYYGTVTNISDVINFRAALPQDAPKEFAKSVDDYIAFCKERGLEPEAPTEGLDV